jgi:hypothetical protein
VVYEQDLYNFFILLTLFACCKILENLFNLITDEKLYLLLLRWYIIGVRLIIGGCMIKIPNDRGEGWVEVILIVILAILILVTIFLLLRPALSNLWQEFIQSLQ